MKPSIRGHVHVEQHDLERVVVGNRIAQQAERFLAAGSHRGAHAPQREHLAQHEAIRGVVVDDERPAAFQTHVIDDDQRLPRSLGSIER